MGKDTNKNERCLCRSCKMYNKCNKDKAEEFFCLGKSSYCNMEASEGDCICGICPVLLERGISGRFFCINE